MEQLFYVDEDGKLRGVSASWTSAAEEDAFVRVAAGRSAFRVSDLLALASLIESLGEEDRTESGGGSEADSVREILPHL